MEYNRLSYPIIWWNTWAVQNFPEVGSPQNKSPECTETTNVCHVIKNRLTSVWCKTPTPGITQAAREHILQKAP